jgi:hemerythrin-like domain-containing protein
MTNAIELLKKQHKKTLTQLDKLSRAKSAQAAELLQEIAADLAAHMAIEHELVYPRAQEVDEEFVGESLEEHALAEIALKRLMSASPTEPEFHARAIALTELVRHHIEEEEHDLFPKLEKLLGAEELQTLGKELSRRFKELEDGALDLIPKGMSRTAADRARRQLHA